MDHHWEAEAFAELLRIERARRRISQQDVARDLRVSHMTISRWERALGRAPTRHQAGSLEQLFALERGTVALLTDNLPIGQPEVEWDTDGSLVLRFATVAASDPPGSLSGETGLYLSSAAAA